MSEAKGFSVYDEIREYLSPSSETGLSQLISWKIHRMWGERGEAGDFSREFFEALKTISLTQDMLGFTDAVHTVSRHPNLLSLLRDEPKETLTYTAFYLTITLAKDLVYYVRLRPGENNSLKKLLEERVTISSCSDENRGIISLSIVDEPKNFTKLSSRKVEVVSSPLLKKLEKNAKRRLQRAKLQKVKKQ